LKNDFSKCESDKDSVFEKIEKVLVDNDKIVEELCRNENYLEKTDHNISSLFELIYEVLVDNYEIVEENIEMQKKLDIMEEVLVDNYRIENNKLIKIANNEKESKATDISSSRESYESKLKEKDARIVKLETIRLTKEQCEKLKAMKVSIVFHLVT